ncbi:hypothetical protein SB759_05070 [Pseudomonas sp. SIMBA_059]
MKCKPITRAQWEKETATSNRLFAEADRLNDIAYALLSERPASADTIKQFQAAKDAANAKYEEAHAAWNLAREHLKENVKDLLTGANIEVFESDEISKAAKKPSKRTNSNG